MIRNNKAIILLIALLSGITIFSIYKVILSLKEKQSLVRELGQIKIQVSNLENEKQNMLQTLEKERSLAEKLTQENVTLKDDLKEGKSNIAKLKNDFAQVQITAEQLNSQLTVLQVENTNLKAETDKLRLDFGELSQENNNLRFKLSSLTELKKAMGAVKKQVHKISREIRQRIREKRSSGEGNRGFVLQRGKSTCPAKVIIEVNPALNQ
ncbi:MAG: hypothetical protein V2A64_02390 [Candidatus Omnitrophota bacterium]